MFQNQSKDTADVPNLLTVLPNVSHLHSVIAVYPTRYLNVPSELRSSK
jgi:hypothetical protein